MTLPSDVAFSVLDGSWAIVRLPRDGSLPGWALASHDFVSVTRTAHELSIVCPAGTVPDDVAAERGWSVLEVKGPFTFDEIGILASFSRALAEAGVSLFAVSTYDTDYILVRTAALPAAIAALEAAGHPFLSSSPAD